MLPRTLSGKPVTLQTEGAGLMSAVPAHSRFKRHSAFTESRLQKAPIGNPTLTTRTYTHKLSPYTEATCLDESTRRCASCPPSGGVWSRAASIKTAIKTVAPHSDDIAIV
jgi:hypothetical protein